MILNRKSKSLNIDLREYILKGQFIHSVIKKKTSTFLAEITSIMWIDTYAGQSCLILKRKLFLYR